MAMSVQQREALDGARGDRPSPCVFRQEGRHFVAKCQKTTRLEADDRNAARRRVSKHRDNLAKARARTIEHPLIVERPSAAQIAWRNRHAKARALENLDCGDRNLGLEEVVE